MWYIVKSEYDGAPSEVVEVPDMDIEEAGEFIGRGYNLRSRNVRDYSHRLDHLMNNPASN